MLLPIAGMFCELSLSELAVFLKPSTFLMIFRFSTDLLNLPLGLRTQAFLIAVLLSLPKACEDFPLED